MNAGRCSCSEALHLHRSPKQQQQQQRRRLRHGGRLAALPWRPSAAASVAYLRAPAALWKSSRRKRRLSSAGKSGCMQGFRSSCAASLGASTAGFDDKDAQEAAADDESTNDAKNNLKAAMIVSGITAAGTLAAISFTLASGGPAALAAAISKSGFYAAFALIFVSEIGDKTFFIAALLAMRQSRGLVLLGSTGALSIMTIISVVIGRLFQRVPAQLQTTLPLGEYAAVALLTIFGLRAIKAAWELPSSTSGAEAVAVESGELAEAEEFVKQAVNEKTLSTPMAVLAESFSLVFLAEWGDRSMLATVALAATQSPWGVASGAIIGHVLATSLAVLGGAFLAQYISEKVVGYIGGVLFLVFAAATLMGVF